MQTLFPARFPAEREAWQRLLVQEGIRSEEHLDAVYGIFADDGSLVATGARFRNILKCIAIDKDHQGSSLFNTLMSGLMNEVFQQGFSACYVYTKAQARDAFHWLGFREIAHVDDKLYFLENALVGLPQYLNALKTQYVEAASVAAIVMNANPFTNGHLYLVEKAAHENDVVHLFVLSEDFSQFSATVRMALVRAGVAHLPNVYVHPTGDYLISAATFPSYFLREDDDVIAVQARLDARIFKQYIVPTLGIMKRYVGNEPLSPTTEIYNQALAQEFAGEPQLEVVARLSCEGECISASRVRRLLEEGNLEAIRPLVPSTTFRYLSCGEMPSSLSSP
ncbi:MAG: [citrate (pro-3S)-lyase] ligase [Cardiobacteriaceae bacterium]|nr:[citrate (pro-3S)-lyase] ligase [Cardiobacteriaceae bacterium]